jgi:hypothetical protein
MNVVCQVIWDGRSSRTKGTCRFDKDIHMTSTKVVTTFQDKQIHALIVTPTYILYKGVMLRGH